MMQRSNVRVAGVDEVGRGPLAGPVIAAAVILGDRHKIKGLDDSKVLSELKREELEDQIKVQAIAWSIGRAEAGEIDQINILQASLLAMRRAVQTLRELPGMVLVDGHCIPHLPYPTFAIVKGDAKIEHIAAASIIAKVARDREMKRLHIKFPQYGFATNVGYPTAQHLSALDQHGVTPIHRTSFAPVKKALQRMDSGLDIG